MLDEQIIVRIEKDFKERVEFVAKSEERSVSSLVRFLLVKYMQYKDPNFDIFNS